jgi:hypothetical protein
LRAIAIRSGLAAQDYHTSLSINQENGDAQITQAAINGISDRVEHQIQAQYRGGSLTHFVDEGQLSGAIALCAKQERVLQDHSHLRGDRFRQRHIVGVKSTGLGIGQRPNAARLDALHV